MNVIGHDHESVQTVMSQAGGIVMNRVRDYIRQGRLAEITRTVLGLIEQAVQRGKCLTRCKRWRREAPMRGQTALKMPGEKDRLAGDIEVRETAAGKRHENMVSPTPRIS